MIIHHTRLIGGMPPNMGEELLPPHPGIAPSPTGPSNEGPAFGRDEVHT